MFDGHDELLLNGLVENVHERDGIGLHLEHELLDACNEVIIAEIGGNADDKTHDRGDHGDIHTARKQPEVDGTACGRHVHERADHAEHRAEETDHRSAAGDSGQERQTVFELGNLQIGDVLDGGLHVAHGPPDAPDALLYHAGDGGIGLAAQAHGDGNLAVGNVIADAVHEIHVEDRSAADGQKTLDEDENRHAAQHQQGPHQPTALDEQGPQPHAGLLTDGRRPGSLQKTNHNVVKFI